MFENKIEDDNNNTIKIERNSIDEDSLSNSEESYDSIDECDFIIELSSRRSL